MAQEKAKKITSIGGSALIEGIMMRGPKKTVIAVRTAPDKIETEELKVTTLREKYKFLRIPFIRGIAGMIDSLKLSYKSLMLSANKAIDSIEVEEEEMSKFEKWLEKKLGSAKLEKAIVYFSVILSVFMTVGLFILLPTFLAGLADPYINSAAVHNLIEGTVRIVIFMAYLILCSQQKDIKRVFAYHGAEHKTIFCYESGLPLTSENAAKMTKHHPRCGTSFLFVVLVVNILVTSVVFAYVEWRNMWVRTGLHLLMLPLIVGITYEFNRYVGRHDNALTRVLSKPGMWLQNFTTNEPDASMLEVAIAAMEAVIPDQQGKDQW
ncbi:MAG: DUF1385 domain-containing protein [Oscillospiraceae bacterium]|nr:DUF1385 domain-containing protein [Oscillospiraceae bacterium]